jgi:ribonuclease D
MFNDTPLVMVETKDQLNELAATLSRAPIIGVDTESDSFYHYQEKVCLIQFSDLTTDYILDPLGLDDLSILKPIFENPEVTKIFHGGDYDIVCLKRDFDFQTHGVFDTLIAAQLLGLKRLGLADLIKRFYGIGLDKKYQRHDWSRRPLHDEHLEYARGDTHWLLSLREILTRRLRAVNRLAHQEEECLLLEQREWQGRVFDPDGYLRVKRSQGLDDTGKRVLRRLYLYRDEQARKLDRPAFKVLPDSVLVTVADKRPSSAKDLDKVFPGKAPMKRRYGSAIVSCVTKGLEDDFEIPTPRKVSKNRSSVTPRVSGRTAERSLGALKEWRNHLCDTNERFTPFTVASNATLKAIAQYRPKSLEELAEIPDVRRWQITDLGPQILEVLDASDAAPDPKPSPRRRSRRRS